MSLLWVMPISDAYLVQHLHCFIYWLWLSVFYLV